MPLFNDGAMHVWLDEDRRTATCRRCGGVEQVRLVVYLNAAEETDTALDEDHVKRFVEQHRNCKDECYRVNIAFDVVAGRIVGDGIEVHVGGAEVNVTRLSVEAERHGGPLELKALKIVGDDDNSRRLIALIEPPPPVRTVFDVLEEGLL